MHVDNYHLSGSLSALFTLLSLWGLGLQLRRIYIRRRQVIAGTLLDGSTSILSLNRFATSFLAFYGMMLYGICLPDFNYYVVGPRIVAVLLLLAILLEIWRDRRDPQTVAVLGMALIGLLVASLLAASNIRLAGASRTLSSVLVVFSTILFLQGSIHQTIRIRASGETGALSRGMHILFFLKDFFSASFGTILGSQLGWPIMVFHITSGIMQLVTLWHFRWARTSVLAAQRRPVRA
jgi:hypothetical protein